MRPGARRSLRDNASPVAATKSKAVYFLFHAATPFLNLLINRKLGKGLAGVYETRHIASNDGFKTLFLAGFVGLINKAKRCHNCPTKE